MCQEFALTSPALRQRPLRQRRYMNTARTHSSSAMPTAPTAWSPSVASIRVSTAPVRMVKRISQKMGKKSWCSYFRSLDMVSLHFSIGTIV